ncbi:hypothetical protein C0J52_19793 [Blattella germanica]|nr:hypothetical protein C0J52_19793 [Blattella germanica]
MEREDASAIAMLQDLLDKPQLKSNSMNINIQIQNEQPLYQMERGSLKVSAGNIGPEARHASAEDDLQRSVHNMKLIADKYSLEISRNKSKVMAFIENDPHPPASSDYYLFGLMKKFLAGQCFETDSEVKSAIH